MALNANQHALLVRHLQEKWKRSDCPRCDHNGWTITGIVPLALRDPGQGLLVGGSNLPTAAVVCNNCGLTELVNLVAAGVVGDE